MREKTNGFSAPFGKYQSFIRPHYRFISTVKTRNLDFSMMIAVIENGFKRQVKSLIRTARLGKR